MIVLFEVPPVETGIPIPLRQGQLNRHLIDLLRELQVGESRFFDGDDKALSNWQAMASKAGRTSDMKFETRRMMKNGVMGIRIWRVA